MANETITQSPNHPITQSPNHPITQSPNPPLPQGPAIVEVWAPWCGPCRAMAPHFVTVQAEYESRVAVQKVNADTAPELVRALGVMGVPTVIALRDGRELGRRVGYQSAADLRVLFEAALADVPGARLAGPGQLDRMLRLLVGFALMALAAFTGWPWPLVGAAALVLFSAVHDRCPLWQAVRARLLPPRRAAPEQPVP